MWAVRDRRLSAPVLVALITLAWVVLWVWGQSPYGRFLSHHSLEEVRGGGLLMLVFVAGWSLMTVAMMLPTSLPLVVLFHTVVRQRPNRARLVVLLVAAYLSVWALFGIGVYLADWGVHAVVEESAWIRANAWVLGATTVLLAGLYQFTPLKYRCLDKCRSPLSFITAHWRGGHAPTQAIRLGVNHGLFCLGCCWSLMLLMFALGVGNIGWMLALGAMMAVEKNLPQGRRLSAPVGAILIGWAVYLLLPGLTG